MVPDNSHGHDGRNYQQCSEITTISTRNSAIRVLEALIKSVNSVENNAAMVLMNRCVSVAH
jgi:hypothetical protein